MTGSSVRRLAARTGRALLLGAVAFWWGAVVGPRLFSLAFPALLATDAIPPHLNPDLEGSLANAVSAAALLIVALLAFANALRPFDKARAEPAEVLTAQDVSHRKAVRQAHGWTAAGGWTALAATAAYLAWDEVSEFHIARTLALGREVLGIPNNQYLWPVVLSPLIAAFVVAMWFFVHKRLSDWAVRAPLILGVAAWLLAVAHEASYLFLFTGRAEMLEIVLEETLEFGGTLLIGLGAGIALGSEAVSRQPSGALLGRRLLLPLFGSMAAVAVLGGLAVALLFRAPFVNARALTHIGAFHIIVYDKHSLVQELGVLPEPPARFDLRITSRAPPGRSGILIWRVMEAGKETPGSGRILREGRVEVSARDYLSWERIDFPPLVEADGRPLALQLIADVGPRAHLQVGATKTTRYRDGRLWVDGAPTWPDQNIEFVAYSAPEPTRSKLQAMWRIFSSDWRWPVLLADLAVALTLIIFVPVLLATFALPRRG